MIERAMALLALTTAQSTAVSPQNCVLLRLNLYAFGDPSPLTLALILELLSRDFNRP